MRPLLSASMTGDGIALWHFGPDSDVASYPVGVAEGAGFVFLRHELTQHLIEAVAFDGETMKRRVVFIEDDLITDEAVRMGTDMVLHKMREGT